MTLFRTWLFGLVAAAMALGVHALALGRLGGDALPWYGAVILLAVAMSCGFHWIPALKKVSSGFVIIICAVAAAGLGAWLMPIEEE